MEIAGQGGIIPKRDAPSLFVKETHSVFCGGGNGGGGEKEQRRMPGDGGGKGDDPGCPNPVDRAEREKEHAFAVLLLGMGGPCVKYLRAETQKAVKEKIPD